MREQTFLRYGSLTCLVKLSMSILSLRGASTRYRSSSGVGTRSHRKMCRISPSTLMILSRKRLFAFFDSDACLEPLGAEVSLHYARAFLSVPIQGAIAGG